MIQLNFVYVNLFILIIALSSVLSQQHTSNNTISNSSATVTTTECPHHKKKANASNSKASGGHGSHAHHGHHMMGSMDDNSTDGMMMMYFHGGYSETILFNFWQTQNVSGFVFSCIAFFVLAALYEGLKLLRERLIRAEIIRKQEGNIISSTKSGKLSSCHCKNNAENKNLLGDKHSNIQNNNHSNLNEDEVVILDPNHSCCKNNKNNNANNNNNLDNSKLVVIEGYSARLLSQGHIIQSVLHMLQVTLSYFLMLVFMTYNSWLCASIVLGAGIGYFFFGLKRLTTIDVNEHCH